MRSLLARPLALPWAMALAFAVAVGAAGSVDVFWMGDFYLEAYPAYQAVMAGDWSTFVDKLRATAASPSSSARPPRC